MVEVHQHFRGACFSVIALMMEALQPITQPATCRSALLGVWRNDKRGTSNAGCQVWTELFFHTEEDQNVSKQPNQCSSCKQVRMHIHILTKQIPYSNNNCWKLQGNYCKNFYVTGHQCCSSLVQTSSPVIIFIPHSHKWLTKQNF